MKNYFCIVLSICFLLYGSSVLAGSLQVTPIHLYLSNQAKITELDLTNKGDQPTTVNLKMLRWQQQNGKDTYQATHDIIATPPIVKIPAQQTQILRVGLIRQPDPAQELAYRLYVQEVPSQLKKNPGAVTVLLRLSIPVFVAPLASVNTQYHLTAQRLNDKQVKLNLVNQGNVHIQVGKLEVKDLVNAQHLSQNAFAYIFPQQQQSWTLSLPVNLGDKLEINAITDNSKITATTTVS